MAGCQVVQTDDDHGDTRTTATPITPAPVTRVSGHLETAADVDSFRLVVRSPGTVYAASRSGDVEVSIESATHSSPGGTFHAALTVDPGPGRPVDVYVRVSGASSARYDLAVWLIERTESEPFTIELVFVGAEPTAQQRKIIGEAAQVWQDAIIRGLPDTPVLSSSWKCEEQDPSPFGEHIDDLRVYIRLKPEERDRGLAVSGVCWQREAGLPLISEVTLFADGLSFADAILRKLVVHELAHALGFGTIGRWDDLLENAAGHRNSDAMPMPMPMPMPIALPDTHFTGQQAVTAFDDLGGASHAGGKVPVENDVQVYGPSSVDSHWREAVFATELMTPRLSASSSEQPLSRVTLAALADLGYDVDYTRAESFALPGRTQPVLNEGSVMLYVGDDTRRGPVGVARTPVGTGSR